MNLLHQVAGVKQVRLAGAGRGTPHVHARHRARTRQHGGAAGGAAGVGVVAHLNAGDIGDGAWGVWVPVHMPVIIRPDGAGAAAACHG